MFCTTVISSMSTVISSISSTWGHTQREQQKQRRRMLLHVHGDLVHQQHLKAKELYGLFSQYNCRWI
jgi:hypothetical protein